MEEVAKGEVATPEVELTERESIYKAYTEAQAEGTSEPAPEEEETPATLPDSGDEGGSVSASSEATAVKVDEKPLSEKKMVPYDALHEERERRKALQMEVEELKYRFNQSQPQEKVEVAPMEGFDTEGNVTDYEVAMKAILKENLNIKRELDTVKSKSTVFESNYQNTIKQEAEAKLAKRVENTTRELVEEGFPGFAEFVPLMSAELNKLIAEDRDNVKFDNEAGWKQIYKERIFPKITNSIGEHLKKDSFEQKKALKEKANLATKPGAQPSKQVKDEEWTKGDYMKMRQRYNTEEL